MGSSDKVGGKSPVRSYRSNPDSPCESPAPTRRVNASPRNLEMHGKLAEALHAGQPSHSSDPRRPQHAQQINHGAWQHMIASAFAPCESERLHTDAGMRERKIDESNARSPTVEDLASLPDPALFMLADLSTHWYEPGSEKHGFPATCIDEVGKALWRSLEINTECFKSKWQFLHNPGTRELSFMSNAQAERNRRFLPRFNDINPVKSSAIADPIRSVEPGVTPYLNANRVDLRCGVGFIACQLPVASEVPGFHQMLMDNKVGLIVDLTLPSERDDTARYVPASGKVLCAQGQSLQVACGKKSRLLREKIHMKELCLRDGANVQTVKRLHFKGWPDQGVISSKNLTSLADRVESLNPDPSKPIVVHCRAGVGRTGTLMSFIAARKRLQERVRLNDGLCDPKLAAQTLMEVVAKGRIDRGPSFVQTEQQFALIFTALLASFAEEMRATPTHMVVPTPVSPGWRAVDPAPPYRYPTAEERRTAGPLPTDLPDLGLRIKIQPDRAAPDMPPESHVFAASHAPGAPVVQPVRPAPPAPNQARPSSVTRQVDAMLANWRHEYLDPGQVEDNGSQLGCVAHSAVSVHVADVTYRIHANRVNLSLPEQPLPRLPEQQQPQLQPLGVNRSPANFVAGQAAHRYKECEKLLVHAIQESQGVFEIVGRNAHARLLGLSNRGAGGEDSASGNQSVLQHLLKNRQEVIAGRFKILSMRVKSHDEHHALVVLKVKDLQNGEEKSVPLMQVGLRFKDAVLRQKEIDYANRALKLQITFNQSLNRDVPSEPVMISPIGIGRNAAVMIYHTLKEKIDDGTISSHGQLDAALATVVAQGRRARGPRFVHSEPQLAELRAALQSLITP